MPVSEMIDFLRVFGLPTALLFLILFWGRQDTKDFRDLSVTREDRFYDLLLQEQANRLEVVRVIQENTAVLTRLHDAVLVLHKRLDSIEMVRRHE